MSPGCLCTCTSSKTNVDDRCEKGLNLVNVQFVYETDEHTLMKFFFLAVLVEYVSTSPFSVKTSQQ